MTQPSAAAALDIALTELNQQQVVWANLPPATVEKLLAEVMDDLSALGEEWVAASCAAKGVPPGSFAVGEEWVNFGGALRALRLLGQSVGEIARHGHPLLPYPLRQRSDGRVVAQVFPDGMLDQALFPGVRSEVWMQPGQTSEQVLAQQAWAYQAPRRTGALCLVFAAGNVAALGLIDLFYQLVVERQVVLLKTHPVTAYLSPIFARGLRALIRRGFVRIVDGGIAESAYLSRHPQVDSIHITGSDRTYEALVFGPGAEGAQRKAARAPLLDKPVTAELGNVSPMIVVPGPWSGSDLYAYGARLATWLGWNAGFACLAPRVIVTQRGWAGRDGLLREIVAALGRAPTRSAYYPGAQERHAAFLGAHPRAIQVGSPAEGQLPWTLIPDVDSQGQDEICFRSEAFCGLFAETTLEAEGPAAFLARAVRFANEQLWGTLTATILIHPTTLRDPVVAAALDQAIADLRYGTVCVNQFGGVSHGLATAPWGGFPGQPPHDIQSGVGWVNNALMFAAPEKSVLYAPFRTHPDPLVLDFPHMARLGRQIAAFQARPGWGKLSGMLWTMVGR
jgi:acyl-CoA reductase-like NAD-dependent aldehyde dehydrogenase